MNPIATLVTLVSFAQERLRREEKGATAVEYGLLVGLIAAVIIGTVFILGGRLDDMFNAVLDVLPGGN